MDIKPNTEPDVQPQVSNSSPTPNLPPDVTSLVPGQPVVAQETKPKLHVGLFILLTISFYLGAGILALIVTDIMLGALSGTPETGWGMVIAMFVYAPLFVVFGTISFFVGRSITKKGKKLRKTVVSAVIVAVIITGMGNAWGYVSTKYQGVKESYGNIQSDEAEDLLIRCKVKFLHVSPAELADVNPGEVHVYRRDEDIESMDMGREVSLKVESKIQSAKQSCPNMYVDGI